MSSLFALKAIAKNFGGVHALSHVDFDLNAGEVQSLIGENGAGKSTLMRVVNGEFAPSAGELYLHGQLIKDHSPKKAIDKGIAIIHQELALAPDLTVAENIFLGDMPRLLNWKRLYKNAEKIISSLGYDISPSALVGSLSIAQQQIVEIAKALSKNAKAIIFDEPTAVLSVQDAQKLLAIISGLRDRGVGIVYISHRLDEVLQISDRITVLKDGASVETVQNSNLTTNDLIAKMVGRDLDTLFGEEFDRQLGEVVLSATNIGRANVVKDASFQVRAGEILGLGGLVGSGRTELARLIFGADKLDKGQLQLHGKKVKIASPKRAVFNGVGLVPENRKEEGVILNMPIQSNMTMSKMLGLTRFGIIKRSKEAKCASELGSKLNLKAGALSDPVSSLSGGNQQKVALAKWFHADVDILICDEPTRGVDVGAKREIYTLIRKLAASGKAIIVISSEHHELFGLCDRVLVMSEGEIKGELSPDDYNEKSMLNLAMPTTSKLGALSNEA